MTITDLEEQLNVANQSTTRTNASSSGASYRAMNATIEDDTFHEPRLGPLDVEGDNSWNPMATGDDDAARLDYPFKRRSMSNSKRNQHHYTQYELLYAWLAAF
jgi:hypothetical protein